MTIPSSTARRLRFEQVAAEVYEPVQRYLLRRADRDTAEDTFSEVLTVLWRRIDDVPEGAALPWAYGIARRTLANARRSHDRRRRLMRRLSAERPVTPVEPSGLDADLHEALSSLAPKHREVLHLWAWEQLEASEIATVLGCSANAASIRLHRARRALEEELLRKTGPVSGHRGNEPTEEERS